MMTDGQGKAVSSIGTLHDLQFSNASSTFNGRIRMVSIGRIYSILIRNNVRAMAFTIGVGKVY
jgi:hypothetical protein